MSRSHAARSLGITAALLALSGPIRPQSLQEGDLLVGAHLVEGFGIPTYYGVIHRLRGGSLTDFCTSPTGGPDFWYRPHDVILDSLGRVVWLAQNSWGYGLYRCDTFGGTPENLALFPTGTAVGTGWPVPFPGEVFDPFTFPAGLHLATLRSVVIDDKVNGGEPQLITEDAYVFAVRSFTQSEVRIVRFRVSSGVWEEGPEPIDRQNMPDCINHSGLLYQVGPNSGFWSVLRRTKEPLRISASGQYGNLHFSVQLDLFGGFKEVSQIVLNDSALPDIPSGCIPDPQGQISNLMPFHNGFAVMDGFTSVSYDEHSGLGLVLHSSSTAAGTPYMTRTSEALINDDQSDDLPQHWQNGYSGTCAATPALHHTGILPFWSPLGKFNGVSYLASTTLGMVGTQGTLPGSVVLVKNDGDDEVDTLVEGLLFPGGVAGYPAVVPPASGVVIVIRVDSPMHALVTDAAGLRIGTDPLSGLSINDFGEDGFDSGPGEPRFFAIQRPAGGTYALDAKATTAEPSAIHLYAFDLVRSTGEHHTLTNGVDRRLMRYAFSLRPSGGIVIP